MIRSPTVPSDHCDRLHSCKEALEARFVALVERQLPLSVLYREAIAAGWDELEVRLSLSGLLYSRVELDLARLEEEGALQEARQKPQLKVRRKNHDPLTTSSA